MPIRGWQYCPKPPNQVLDHEQFELSKPTSYQIKVYFNQAIKGKQTKQQSLLREGVKKINFFLGKSPKLWVGGGQES